MVGHPSTCDLIVSAARAHPPGFLEGGMGGAAQCYTAGPLDEMPPSPDIDWVARKELLRL